ncbi:MAG: hypothetical protein ACXWEE_02780 [Thermoleophilaceae bacterium]
MKRTLLLLPVLVAALVWAPAASARIVELGAVADAVNPSCPADPCEAAVRVTGLQGRAAGGPKNPYYIRRSGYVVAFTVTLAAPTAEQVAFFNDNFGSPAEVGLSVLRKSDKKKTRLNYRLVNQSQLFEVENYFGSKPTFVLDQPMRVRKTNWIAITVPTWAPIFANNLTRSDWWRSSRAKNSCETPRSLRQFAMTELREVNMFGCTYSGARLLFTATYVPDPKPTVQEEEN